MRAATKRTQEGTEAKGSGILGMIFSKRLLPAFRFPRDSGAGSRGAEARRRKAQVAERNGRRMVGEWVWLAARISGKSTPWPSESD